VGIARQKTQALEAKGNGVMRTLTKAALLGAGAAILLFVTACPATAQADDPGPWVELTRPQSDDQGHYCGLKEKLRLDVEGLVAAPGEVSSVAVNDKQARLLFTGLKPFGAPDDSEAIAFKALLWLEPQTEVSVVVTLADGTQHTSTFVPDTETMIARLRELLLQTPRDPQALLRMNYLSDPREDRLARTQDALDINPGLAEAHLQLGGLIMDQYDREPAIAEFKEAVRLAPEYAEAYFLLGMALSMQGMTGDDEAKSEEAIIHLKEAIRLDPDYLWPRMHLGWAYLHGLGDFEAAIAAFEGILTIDPQYHEAHHGLARVCVKQGDLDGAIAKYKDALEIDPNDSMVHWNLGRALEEQGKTEEALAAYRKSFEIMPKFYVAGVSVGNLLADEGRMDEAIAAYKQAIEAWPEYAEAHYRLAEAYYKLKRYAEAKKEAEKTVELDPNHNEVYPLLHSLKNRGY